LIKLDRIGDGILVTPLLRELRNALPNSRIVGIFDTPVAEMLALSPNLDRIVSFQPPLNLPLPKSLCQILSHRRLVRNELASESFDLILVPRYQDNNHGGLALAAMLGRDRVVAYANEKRYDRIFPHLVPVDSRIRHEVDRNLDLLRSLNLPVRDVLPEITLSSADEAFAEEVLASLDKSIPIVALGVGSALQTKVWPADSFVKMIEILAAKRPISVVLIASGDEVDIAKWVAGQIQVPCLTPHISLRGLAGLLKRVHLFIGNDSGPAHIASAVATPTIVISSHPLSGGEDQDKNPARFAPYGEVVRVCQPKHGLPGCEVSCISQKSHCIAQVEAQTVADLAYQILSNSIKPRHPQSERYWQTDS
jgi:ADP-heptose:LPS heptosyltransferase